MPSAARTPPPGALPLVLSGEAVVLLPERAALWHDLLLVADVHLGKGDHFRARGLPLPPGELDEDLDRLAALVAATGARRLRVLGDLVHGRVGAATEARVAAWAAALPAAIELVPGNHDRHEAELPTAWGVRRLAPEVHEGPFTFAHAPDTAALTLAAADLAARGRAGAPTADASASSEPGGARRVRFAGHVHPTAALSGLADRLRFPAFIVTEALVLLPAFSRFSGGPVVRAAPGLRRYACLEDEVLALDG